MFVSGLANALWIVPLALLIVVGVLAGVAIVLNRWRRRAGWVLLVTVFGLACYGVEYLRNGPSVPTPVGTIDVQVGEPFARSLQRSTYRFREDMTLTTGDVVNLRLRIGNHALVRPAVGGMDSAILSVSLDYPSRTVESVAFSDQHRPLRLDDMIARAKSLDAWFAAAGFRPSQGGASGPAGFAVTETVDKSTHGEVAGWAAAERLLADDPRITAMNLFRCEADGVVVRATARNWARSGNSIYRNNFGREWELAVWIGKEYP